MNTVQRQYNYEESSALIPCIKKKYCLKSPITKIFQFVQFSYNPYYPLYLNHNY